MPTDSKIHVELRQMVIAIETAVSLGAAYLAGLTVGVYQNTDELTDLWRSERRFLPTLDRPRAQELMERWEHAVRQTVL